MTISADSNRLKTKNQLQTRKKKPSNKKNPKQLLKRSKTSSCEMLLGHEVLLL